MQCYFSLCQIKAIQRTFSIVPVIGQLSELMLYCQVLKLKLLQVSTHLSERIFI